MRVNKNNLFSTTLNTKVLGKTLEKLQYHLIFIVYYSAFQSREQQLARLWKGRFLLHCILFVKADVFPEDLGSHART